MKRLFFVVVTLFVAAMTGCAPGATEALNDAPPAESTASIAAQPARPTATVAPPPTLTVVTPAPDHFVLFSTVDGDDFVEDLDRIAKTVHPVYRLATRTLSYDGNNVARYLTHRLSNGVTRIVIWPFDQNRIRRVQPVIDAFITSGVATESGLPELSPLPIPFLTISSASDIFRFYRGTPRSELLEQARTCSTDYVFKRDLDSLWSIIFDATDMPDGRTRLYVDIQHSRPTMTTLTELQGNVGLVLACLEQRVGTGTES